MEFCLTKEEINAQTYKIIGAAMAVHNKLGSGFLEKVYENALAVEFGLLGIPFETQRKVAVYYKDKTVGDYVADILVDGWIILELKAANALSLTNDAQCINYLNALKLDLCLLVNFGAEKLEWKRFVQKDVLTKMRANPQEKIQIKKADPILES